jgi:hypothetical protein
MLIQLQKEWAPFDVIDLLYGIKKEEKLLGGFRAWSSRLRRPKEVERSDSINRWSFEAYLQQSGLLSVKMAAGRLGMTKESFEEVLAKLEERNSIADKMVKISDQVVPESLVRSFHELFPDVRFKVFGNHSSYCKTLHQAIEKELKIEAQSIHCVTSEALGDDPSDFAYQFDCLTGDPIGLRYQVWLDFGKPFFLSPDACSLKLYEKNERYLKKFVLAGRLPEVPPGLKHKGRA